MPDFSNIDFSNIDVDAILKDYQDRQDAGEPEPFESFFTEPSPAPVMPSAPAGFIPPPPGSTNTMAFVDYYNPTTGETWSAPSGGWTAPEGWVIGRPDGGLKFTFDGTVAPSMPTTPVIQQPITPVVQEPTPIGDIRDTYTPEQVAELERKEIERRAREEANIINKYGSRENLQNQINESLFKDFVTPQTPVIPEPVMQPPARQEVPFVPKIPNIPMNFTGLPQMPVIPNIPVMPELPIVPQPIQPMNFTRLSNLPVSNFVQPSVEDIVSPISRGRTLPPTPRGLFSL